MSPCPAGWWQLRTCAAVLAIMLHGCNDGPPAHEESPLHAVPTTQEPRFNVLDTDPPEDRELAPYTGYSREHWESVLGRLVWGHVRHLSPGQALTTWPGRSSPYLGKQQGLEGVARLMHPIGAWLQDPSAPDTIQFGETRVDLVAMMRNALLHGTDPEHPEYWGDIGDVDQRIVEASDVSWFLWLTRSRLWDKLSREQKTQIVDWLRQVDLRKVHHNNWHMFPLTVHTVRKHLGEPFMQEEIRRHNERTDVFVTGDGWYADGADPRHFDFYNPWAIHMGKLQWAHLDGDSWPEERDAAIAMTRAFVYNFPYFFGSNGALPAWGRSLTYRFSVLAAPLYLRWIGASPIADGLLRRLASGQLRYFVEHGAITPDGQIPQGYWGARPAIIEQYIGPGSPNWSGRGLVALLFPPTDSFWTSPELPLPVEVRDFQRTIPTAGLSLVGNKATGQVQMLSAITSHGSSNDYPAKYGKLRYSTHFLPNVLHTEKFNYAPDAMLMLSRDGERYCQRIDADWGHAMPGAIVSGYGCKRKGAIAKIVSVVVAEGEAAVTVHLVIPEADVGKMQFVEGSLALQADATTETQVDSEQRWSHATGAHGSVFSKGLHGYDEPWVPGGFEGNEGLSLAYDRSIQAMLAGQRQDARPFVLASLSVASPTAFEPGAVNDLVHGLEVDVAAASATFVWGEDEHVFVSLEREPRSRSVRLGDILVEGRVRVARVAGDHSRVSGGGILRVRTTGADPVTLYEVVGGMPAVMLVERTAEGTTLHTDQPCRVDAPTASTNATTPRLSAPGGTGHVELDRDGRAVVLTQQKFTELGPEQGLTLAMLEIPEAG